MKFLNTKTEVIDLQLTSYGRYLLSTGKFRPHFYNFCDDGILYDSQYGGFDEEQKDIQNRIKSKTPRLQVQANYSGVESHIQRDLAPYVSPQQQHDSQVGIIPLPNSIQIDQDKYYSLKYPIGSTDVNTSDSPAWNITFLKGAITGSVNFLTGAYPTLNIPQITPKPIQYVTSIQKGDISDYTDADGSYIDVSAVDGEIILDISEENVFFGTQNFELQAFVVEKATFDGLSLGDVTDDEEFEVLTPLHFIESPTLVQNNLLLDKEETDIESEAFLNFNPEQVAPLDPTYVGYYMDISADKEIDEQTLCDLTVDHSAGVFSTRELVCEKKQATEVTDGGTVFDTDATDVDEECP